MTTKVVFPAAISGIVAAVILGISRALGETMVVAIAAGGTGSAVRTWNPLRARADDDRGDLRRSRSDRTQVKAAGEPAS